MRNDTNLYFEQHVPPQPRFATVHLTSGLRLHYAEQGDRTEEAIIFLHGYSDSWFSFSRVLPLLSPEYHAFALTERGHGDSDKPECCYTVDDFAADINAFMDAIGTEEATIVGHSGGGLIAQRLALSYPHRVSRLVLIGTAAEGSSFRGVSELGEFVRTLTDPVPPEFVREFQESTIYYPVPEEFPETVISESLKLPARVWRDYFEGVVLADAAQLREIKAPTLIMWGEHDTYPPREEQERFAREIPDATLKVYPDTGHAVHWERPEQVVRDLEAFMKDSRPAQ
jgi:pimeloyl-ACP methyl ester carboxylesterase